MLNSGVKILHLTSQMKIIQREKLIINLDLFATHPYADTKTKFLQEDAKKNKSTNFSKNFEPTLDPMGEM